MSNKNSRQQEITQQKTPPTTQQKGGEGLKPLGSTWKHAIYAASSFLLSYPATGHGAAYKKRITRLVWRWWIEWDDGDKAHQVGNRCWLIAQVTSDKFLTFVRRHTHTHTHKVKSLSLKQNLYCYHRRVITSHQHQHSCERFWKEKEKMQLDYHKNNNNYHNRRKRKRTGVRHDSVITFASIQTKQKNNDDDWYTQRRTRADKIDQCERMS